jgi:arylsulfatase
LWLTLRREEPGRDWLTRFPEGDFKSLGIDLVGTPVVETIGSEAKSRFTGHIRKVTVEINPMKAADKAEKDKLRTEVALKKTLSY